MRKLNRNKYLKCHFFPSRMIWIISFSPIAKKCFITVLKITFYPSNEKKRRRNWSNYTKRRIPTTSKVSTLSRKMKQLFPAGKPQTSTDSSDSSMCLMPSFFSLRMESKGKGRREQQQQHKKLLAAMLSQDSFDSALHGSVSSVAEEEMEDEDDAMELLGKLASSRHTCPWDRPGSFPTIIYGPLKKRKKKGKDKLTSAKWPPFVRTPIRMFQCPSGPHGAAVWRRQEIYVFLSRGWTAFALVRKRVPIKWITSLDERCSWSRAARCDCCQES